MNRLGNIAAEAWRVSKSTSVHRCIRQLVSASGRRGTAGMHHSSISVTRRKLQTPDNARNTKDKKHLQSLQSAQPTNLADQAPSTTHKHYSISVLAGRLSTLLTAQAVTQACLCPC